MSHDAPWPSSLSATEFFVPGTCFVPSPRMTTPDHAGKPAEGAPRNPNRRSAYLTAALADIPRLLGAIDRNPYRPTYGCLDRQHWHYRTASFPSEMHQEGVLPLALVYTKKLPGNRWHLNPRVRELAVAALRFAAARRRRDGSCDDYYPFERALGAAVFSLAAAARAYQLLDLHDAEILAWFQRRARWIVDHDETGRLANHEALAALGLLRVADITGEGQFRRAAVGRIDRLLSWQSDEGWFEEYGGADPGYQTVTIDCLAKIRRLTGDAALDKPLRNALAFVRHFLHPDGSFAGEYGSRGTYHFYPHGMELLAADNVDAADLADGFLLGLAADKQGHFSDDRMFAHRLGNLIEAYADWSPVRPTTPIESPNELIRYFPRAGLLVRRTPTAHTVISTARGGVFKHFLHRRAAATDAGLILETSDGRVAVSQMHDPQRAVEDGDLEHSKRLTVIGQLHYSCFELATPIKQAMFHVGMSTVGRGCRTLVRRLLQHRLITGRQTCPVRAERVFEFLPEPPGEQSGAAPRLRVTDTIELTSPAVRIRRMSFGTDHQDAYVAASAVYQDSVLQPWVDLGAYVDELNANRRVTVVREI